MTFFLYPVINQMLGFLIYIFIIFEKTPDFAADLALIYSLVGIIGNVALFKFDMLLQHEQTYKKISDFHVFSYFTFFLSITTFTIFFVAGMIPINLHQFLIAAIISIITVMYNLSYSELVRKSNTDLITKYRGLSILLTILLTPLIFFYQTTFLISFLQICRNQLTFIVSMPKLGKYNLFHLKKIIFRLRHEGILSRALVLLFDSGLNQVSFHLMSIFLYTSSKNEMGTAFIILGITSSINGFWSKTFGLKMITDRTNEIKLRLQHFFTRTITFIAALATMTVIMNNAVDVELLNGWSDLKNLIFPGIVLLAVQLLASSGTQLYLIQKDERQLLKANFVSSSVRIIMFLSIWTTMDFGSIALLYCHTTFYLSHIIILYFYVQKTS